MFYKLCIKITSGIAVLVVAGALSGCKESTKRGKQSQGGGTATQQEELKRNCENAGRVWSNGRCLPATNTVPTNEEDCRNHPGFVWSNGQCIAQNAGQSMTEQQCLATGRQWVNGTCVAAGNLEAACRNINVVSGAMSCLNARITHIDTALRGVTGAENWLSQARDDINKVKTRYQKVQERQISDSSNFMTKTMACFELTQMQFNASQLRRRIDGASPEQPNLLRDAQTLNETVKATKSAVGCVI